MRKRWEFWKWERLPCKDGLQYLVRLRLIWTPFGGVFLHNIHHEDDDRDPHTHPWAFVSIILRGQYTERYYPKPNPAGRSYYTHRTWRRGSIHRMDLRSAHRITEVSPGLVSLIITGPKRQPWGFHTDDGFVPWARYKQEVT